MRNLLVLHEFYDDFNACFTETGKWQVYFMPLYSQAKYFLQHATEDHYDCVLFTGGSDVSPEAYGEARHPETGKANTDRDLTELDIFQLLPRNILKLGVCRGIQTLAVCHGSKLIQHIGGHAGVKQKLHDPEFGDFVCTSTHHQCVDKTTLGPDAVLRLENPRHSVPEVIYWPKTNTLGMQFHPEWGPESSTRYLHFIIDNLAEFPTQAQHLDNHKQFNGLLENYKFPANPLREYLNGRLLHKPMVFRGNRIHINRPPQPNEPNAGEMIAEMQIQEIERMVQARGDNI